MNTLVEEKIAESIIEITAPEKGALWLDEHAPGWYNRINLYTFQITSGMNCVIGQVYGSYTWISQIFVNDIDKKSYELGFHASPTGLYTYREHPEEWDALQDQWVEIIRERQAA